MKGNKRGQDGMQIKRAVVHDLSPEPGLEGSDGTKAQFKQGAIQLQINRPQSMHLLKPDPRQIEGILNFATQSSHVHTHQPVHWLKMQNCLLAMAKATC